MKALVAMLAATLAALQAKVTVLWTCSVGMTHRRALALSLVDDREIAR